MTCRSRFSELPHYCGPEACVYQVASDFLDYGRRTLTLADPGYAFIKRTLQAFGVRKVSGLSEEQGSVFLALLRAEQAQRSYDLLESRLEDRRRMDEIEETLAGVQQAILALVRTATSLSGELNTLLAKGAP